MARLALLGLLASLAAPVGATAAPVPKHLMPAPQDDRAKFQGKWAVESLRVGGKELGAAGVHMVIEFAGDTVTATVTNGGAGAQATTSVVKYGAPGVRQLTNTRTGAGGKAPATLGDEIVGYAFDGDRLLIASAAGGKKPADPLKPGNNDIVLVLVRVK